MTTTKRTSSVKAEPTTPPAKAEPSVWVKLDKETSAFQVRNGCFVRVSSAKGEALEFVPNLRIDENGETPKLVAI